MVFDSLENASQYFSLNTQFEQAFTYLQKQELKNLSVGKYEIDGDNIFAIVVKEVGRGKDKALLETHEQYIDIQLMVSGIDNMGWRDKATCEKPTMDYDKNKDVQLFSDKPDIWIETKPGKFAIFFPEDAHMPMISDNLLHKIVVKVKVE